MASSPSYLLPRTSQDELPSALDKALTDVEHQFDTPTDLLKQITDRMLWEFNKGLAGAPTDDESFMCVPLPRLPSSSSSRRPRG